MGWYGLGPNAKSKLCGFVGSGDCIFILQWNCAKAASNGIVAMAASNGIVAMAASIKLWLTLPTWESSWPLGVRSTAIMTVAYNNEYALITNMLKN